MSRVAKALQVAQDDTAQAVEGEIEELNARPDDIPKEVWDLMQENGRIATERLHEILSSPRFMRYKPADQAKLITLAQNRAYGMPKTNNAANSRKRGSAFDVTAAELHDLARRALLPEYKGAPQSEGLTSPDSIEEAEILPN